jgi:ribonuclease HII
MSRKEREPAVGTAFEEEARRRGFRLVAGVDEVGRGALAGPVVAAAVILDPERPLPKGLNDSKKLTALQRERIAEELKSTALCYAVGLVSNEEIDRTNILVATKRAMCDAISRLCPSAEFALIDAVQLREIALPHRAIIRGDSCCASIAAASVVAKTYRDTLMRELHLEYPHYGFDAHVGYGTRAHWEALRLHGPCALHRRTFRGVVIDPEQSAEASPGEMSAAQESAPAHAVDARSTQDKIAPHTQLTNELRTGAADASHTEATDETRTREGLDEVTGGRAG